MSDKDVSRKHSDGFWARFLRIFNALIFPLRQRWFWMLFFVFTGGVLGIFLLVWLFFVLPGGFKLIELVVVGIFYVLVSGYLRERGK